MDVSLPSVCISDSAIIGRESIDDQSREADLDSLYQKYTDRMRWYLDHNQFTGRIPDAFYKHTFLKEMYIEGNAFRPGVNPIGVHNVLEVSDTEFLF
ncbi:hypothetical protein CsSME_00046409 [Camellia sinensis var. sinensis]